MQTEHRHTRCTCNWELNPTAPSRKRGHGQGHRRSSYARPTVKPLVNSNLKLLNHLYLLKRLSARKMTVKPPAHFRKPNRGFWFVSLLLVCVWVCVCACVCSRLADWTHLRSCTNVSCVNPGVWPLKMWGLFALYLKSRLVRAWLALYILWLRHTLTQTHLWLRNGWFQLNFGC